MAFLIFNLHCGVVERKLENIFAIVLEKKFLDCAYITRSSITTIFHYKNNVKSLRTVFFWEYISIQFAAPSFSIYSTFVDCPQYLKIILKILKIFVTFFEALEIKIS